MSIQAISWALKQSAVKRGEKMVLVALANYADENGECFPSHKRLAEDTGYTRQGVGKVIRHLEDIGLLEINSRDRENGSRTSNVYVLSMGATTVAGKATTVARGATGGNNIEPSFNHNPPVPSEQPPPKVQSKATRLPDDWQPSADDVAFAEQEGLSSDEISRECGKFRDYWHGVGGQRGTKRDWPATWRNWIRRAADDRRAGPKRGGNGGKPSAILAAAAINLDRGRWEHGGAGNPVADVRDAEPGGSATGSLDHGGGAGSGAPRGCLAGPDEAAFGDESAGHGPRRNGDGERDIRGGTGGVSGGCGAGSVVEFGADGDVFPPAGRDSGSVPPQDGGPRPLALVSDTGAGEGDGLDLPGFLRRTA